MTSRTILLNPGPVNLSERVRAALAGPDLCHREPEFADLTRDVNRGLAAVYPSFGEFDAVTLSGSGTAAVEAMLVSFAPRDGATLVAANGVYGERIAAMLAAHGRPSQTVKAAWLEPIDLAAVEALLDRHPEVTHVAAVHHETTTGRLNDLDLLGRMCRERGLHLLLDAVSSFGAEAIDAGNWNLAALAATANKCLHGAPGPSFVLARRERWDHARDTSSVYLNLHRYHAMQHGDGYSPFTLAVPAVRALHEALREHAEEGGWEARRARYRSRAAGFAATLRACGLTTLIPEESLSAVLWSWVLPVGRHYPALHDALKARGVIIYAGQGALSDRAFRIAHMGAIDDDLERVRTALAECLRAS